MVFSPILNNYSSASLLYGTLNLMSMFKFISINERQGIIVMNQQTWITSSSKTYTHSEGFT